MRSCWRVVCGINMCCQLILCSFMMCSCLSVSSCGCLYFFLFSWTKECHLNKVIHTPFFFFFTKRERPCADKNHRMMGMVWWERSASFGGLMSKALRGGMDVWKFHLGVQNWRWKKNKATKNQRQKGFFVFKINFSKINHWTERERAVYNYYLSAVLPLVPWRDIYQWMSVWWYFQSE